MKTLSELPEDYGSLLVEVKLAVKDEYTIDFQELGEKHSERELGYEDSTK